MRRTIAALGCLVALAGCGGSSAKAMSADEIGSKLGCTAFEEQTSLYSQLTASCGKYEIDTFKSSDNQSSWYGVAKTFGGSYLVGNRWVVSADTKAQLVRAQKKLGGDLK